VRFLESSTVSGFLKQGIQNFTCFVHSIRMAVILVYIFRYVRHAYNLGRESGFGRIMLIGEVWEEFKQTGSGVIEEDPEFPPPPLPPASLR